MIDFNGWLKECEISDSDKPDKPGKKNKEGGYDPDTPERKKKFKKVDLITLPKNISGTNCGNCSFNHEGFCYHKEIMDFVNNRMCCSEWTHPDVIRKF